LGARKYLLKKKGDSFFLVAKSKRTHADRGNVLMRVPNYGKIWTSETIRGGEEKRQCHKPILTRWWVDRRIKGKKRSLIPSSPNREKGVEGDKKTSQTTAQCPQNASKCRIQRSSKALNNYNIYPTSYSRFRDMLTAATRGGQSRKRNVSGKNHEPLRGLKKNVLILSQKEIGRGS